MAKTNFIVRGGADFSEIEKKFQSLEKKMKGIGKKLESTGKTMTAAITLPVAAAGTAAFKMAADMQDALGATDQIFGKSSEEMKKWSKNLESYYGIASGEALEYGNMMGSMLQNIGGLTEQEAAKQSQTLIKLAGDLTAMYGGTTEDAVHALTGALKGNNTMLDNYGMAVNDAMIKTKAFEMGIYSGKGEMDLATKQAATLALIMEQSGAAQGQAAREADSASGSMRAMTTELKNLAVSFGEILLPIITPLIVKLKEMVQRFGALDENTKKIIVTVALFAAAVGPVLIVVGKLLQSVNSIISGVKALGTAFSFLAANPIVLVAAAIAALVLGIKYLWDTNENFRNGVIKIWDGITGAIKGYVNAILRFVNALIGAFNKIQVKIPDWVPGFGGKSFGINIPKVPYLAEGGIVNSPTLAMIGEAGPEAVVPLRDGMRNNATQNINVTIELDGKVLARQLFKPLENEKRVQGRVLAGGTI
jgi:phage-related minor tail protein